MSHWNGHVIVRFEPYRNDEHHDGWWWIDCGCCAGIEWSAGYVPVECRGCDGAGWQAWHEESGRLALWPGGPFRGVLAGPRAERLAEAAAA